MLNEKSKIYMWISLILMSLIVRIYLSQFEGYSSDIWYFKIWSRAAYYNEFQDFYSSVWSDYPPFYIYVLWFVGFIYSFFSSSFDINTTIFTILIKSPANIIDIITSFLIFIIVKKYAEFRTALLIMLSYLFNPAIIYNSAVWGQVDSINTIFILLTLFFMVSGKLELAGISVAVAILTKPQSLLILPLFVILTIKTLKVKILPVKTRISRLAKISMISSGVFVTLALPFHLKSLKITDVLVKIIRPYTTGYNEYSYTSLNAFNLWAFPGFWKPDDIPFLFLSYRLWSYILFGILFIYVLYVTVKTRDNRIIYFASAILFFGFFMLFTRVHERYLFPMFAPLAVVMYMDRRLVFIYWIMTFTFLFNLYDVLSLLHTGQSILHGYPYVFIISAINLGVLMYAIYCLSTFQKLKDTSLLPGNE
ncbi:hypothetical protein [Candidatus Methanoperedens nitratireducens]|uniref:Uncharacterized protein n=1 Tax=Candidatus Methanoperedens nitratireducens TaxID=1392998 RepID=A0A284VIU3_9EURY|nr:hypothetical protein [Candidatus Methanoperedens nitroreducens]SNQ59170.1 membrane hypothetical protein [Candidatus Methanoperedens nitroreducens]